VGFTVIVFTSGESYDIPEFAGVNTLEEKGVEIPRENPIDRDSP
jgi:hypothetical protein